MSARVLVVTTRTSFAEPLSVALRASDLDYVGSRSLAAADTSLHSELPGAVVVDLTCVDGDIAGLCDAVRARADGSDVPIILCGTGNESIKSTSDALIAGGDGYFALPCSAQRIVAKLATYIGCPVPDLPSSLLLPGADALDQTNPEQRAFSSERHDVVTPASQPATAALLAPAVADALAPDEATVDLPAPALKIGALLDATTPLMLRTLPAAVSGLPHSAEDLSDDTRSVRLSRERTAEGTSFDDEVLEPSSNPDAQADAAVARAAQQRAQHEQAIADARADAERAALRAKRDQERSDAQRAVLLAEREARQQQLEAAQQAARRAAQQADDDAALRNDAAERLALETQRQAEQVAHEMALLDAQAAQQRAVQLQAQQQLEEMRIEAQAKEAAERALLLELRAQTEEAAAAAREALQQTQRKNEVEQQRLADLQVKRQAAQRDLDNARQQARERAQQEQEGLDALIAQRDAAIAMATQVHQQAELKQHEERERLSALERRRAQAELQTQALLEEVAAREIDAQRGLSATESLLEQEQQRLAQLQAQREQAEHAGRQQQAQVAAQSDEVARQLSALQQRADAEREGLAQIEAERQLAQRELEQRHLEHRAEELRLKAELDDLQRHRRAVSDELQVRAEQHREQQHAQVQQLRVLQEQRERMTDEARDEAQRFARDEQRERDKLAELTQQRLEQEEQARRVAEQLREADAQQRERLAVEAQLRADAEVVAREQLAERTRLVQLEEERLAQLQAARLAAQHADEQAQATREQQRADAEARLAQLRIESAQAEREAHQELDRLTRVRAEDELARHELEQRRARARLAFQSGRLDALAPGERALASDVGASGRPTTDAEGNVVGAGLLPIFPVEVDPPAPVAFLPMEPAVGRFIDGELPALLWSAHHLKVTGALDITADDGRARTLYLEDGEPVLLASMLPVDRPEEALLRAGLITAARYNELRAGPLRSPRRTAVLLVNDGALKTEELFPAVRGVLVEQVLSMLEWDSGSFAYQQQRAHAADRVRLEHPLGALLAEGIRRKFDERRLWTVLGGPATLVGPDDRARTLPPLSPQEKLALARLDGTRALEDVIVETTLSSAAVLRAALIAVCCGAGRVLARGLPASANDRAAQRERSVQIDRARVMDRLHAARHGDYFTFLGVELHASAFEVHRAAERLRQRFDPARFADPAFKDMRDALVEIADVSIEAEAVLADETLAEGYRANVIGDATQPAQRRRA